MRKIGKIRATFLLSMAIWAGSVFAQDLAKTINDSSARILIYPNPAFETFYLEVKNVFPESYTVSIYGSDGQLVAEKRTSEEVTAMSLPPGTYSLQLIVGKNVYYEKVIVQ